MKTLGLMMLFLVAVGVSAQPTEPAWKTCRYPVRMFKGQAVVNLSPLFQWWKEQPRVVANREAHDDTNNPEAERPLSAWYHVVGSKVGTIGSSWVVDGLIYTSPTVFTNERFILNHPPTGEEQTYNTLLAEITEAEEETATALDTYGANTNAEMQARMRAQLYRRSNTKVAMDGYRDYSMLAAQKRAAAEVAHKQVTQLEAIRKQAETQLKLVPHSNGQFLVDWFAVLLGHSKQGLPIYDLGVVAAAPP